MGNRYECTIHLIAFGEIWTPILGCKAKMSLHYSTCSLFMVQSLYLLILSTSFFFFKLAKAQPEAHVNSLFLPCINYLLFLMQIIFFICPFSSAFSFLSLVPFLLLPLLYSISDLKYYTKSRWFPDLELGSDHFTK